MFSKPSLSQIKPFSSLNPIALDEVEQLMSVKDYPAGDEILAYSEREDEIYVVLEGLVDLCFTSDEGNETIFASLAKGDLFGFENEDAYATAIEKTTVGIFPKNLLLEIFARRPLAVAALFEVIFSRLKIAEEKVTDLVLLPLRRRIVRELIRLSEKENGETEENYIIRGNLTHERLAKMVGASREAVSRELAKLKKEKVLLSCKKRDYRLDKRKALEVSNEV